MPFGRGIRYPEGLSCLLSGQSSEIPQLDKKTIVSKKVVYRIDFIRKLMCDLLVELEFSKNKPLSKKNEIKVIVFS